MLAEAINKCMRKVHASVYFQEKCVNYDVYYYKKNHSSIKAVVLNHPNMEIF